MSRLIPLLVLLALAAPVRAQSASDLYHVAARHYIGGEREAAEEAAVRGLRLAPDDPKLGALLDRIRQQQEPSDQGGQQQDGQQSPGEQSGAQGRQGNEGEQQGNGEDPQQNQGEGEQGAERPEDEGDGAPSDEPPQEPPERGEPPQPGREGAQPRPDAPRPGEGGATPESMEPVQPGEMTQGEAERILNAVGAEERLLLRRIQRRPGEGRRVEKDW
jgi:hypothetical protein